MSSLPIVSSTLLPVAAQDCTTAARGIVHVPRRFATDEWGGTETVILEISRQQQKAGQEPHIFSSQALCKTKKESMCGVPVRRFRYCYPFLGLGEDAVAAMDKKGGNLFSLSLFASLLTKRGVRLYHAHALNRLGGMVRTAAKWRRKPLVVSVHGGVFDVPTAESQTLLQPIKGKFEWGRPFGALWGARKVLQDADMVVFVGESEAKKAGDQLGHDRFTYLPNGVDCARFAQGDGAAFRAKHNIPQDAFLLLNISRIDAQKNQMLLLKAFAERATHIPSAHLAIMGPVTQPGYAAEMREFAQAAGLQDRVHFLPGLRSHDADLVNAYHACDVFVLPSMHEPFGIVVLEAWSAGKPVIASRVGGLASLLDAERTGLFVDASGADAIDQLAAQITRLHADADLREKLGSAGREEARGKYDWAIIAARLEEIYQLAEQNAMDRRARGNA